MKENVGEWNHPGRVWKEKRYKDQGQNPKAINIYKEDGYGVAKTSEENCRHLLLQKTTTDCILEGL